MSKSVTLYIIIDQSDSMEGQSIGSANDIAANVVLHFKDTIEASMLANGTIRLISVGDKATVLADTGVKEFVWKDISGKGLSNIGEAYKSLDAALDEESGNFIILISDGGFTDAYFTSLNKLMDNPAFSESTRVAVAVGPTFDREQLEFFCGAPYNLATADEIDKVLNMISNFLTSESSCFTNEEVDSSDNWD